MYDVPGNDNILHLFKRYDNNDNNGNDNIYLKILYSQFYKKLGPIYANISGNA